jgi:hypothetical protein
MHGFDAEGNRLVFRKCVALLHAAQVFAAKGHPHHRLKQLTIANLRAALVQALKQLAVELDCPGWRCGHVKDGSAEADTIRTHPPGHRGSRPVVALAFEQAHLRESLSSDDPGCPPVPCSGFMKEILGKQLGL